jgi:hypothetical protein
MKQIDVDEVIVKVWQSVKTFIETSEIDDAAGEVVAVLEKAGWDLEHLSGFDDELDEALYRSNEEPEEELEDMDDIYE